MTGPQDGVGNVFQFVFNNEFLVCVLWLAGLLSW